MKTPVLMLMICLQFAGLAQNLSLDNYQLTLKVGLNNAQITNQSSLINGYEFSADLSFPIDNNWSAGFGLGFSQLGKQISYNEELIINPESDLFGSYKVQRTNYDVNFLSLPVFMRYHFPRFSTSISLHPSRYFSFESIKKQDYYSKQKINKQLLNRAQNEVSNYNLMAALSIGYHQKISRNIQFVVDGEIRKVLFQFYNSVSIDNPQLIFALNVGLSMNLGIKS